MTSPFKVTNLYAFVETDEDGDEGVVALDVETHGEFIPLVFADKSMAEAMVPIIKQAAFTCEIRRYKVVEDMTAEFLGSEDADS